MADLDTTALGATRSLLVQTDSTALVPGPAYPSARLRSQTGRQSCMRVRRQCVCSAHGNHKRCANRAYAASSQVCHYSCTYHQEQTSSALLRPFTASAITTCVFSAVYLLSRLKTITCIMQIVDSAEGCAIGVNLTRTIDE